MKVLVLTGPESSGRSWLAEQLQTRFGGQVVGGYVCHFIGEQRRNTRYADIPATVRRQPVWEDAARAERPVLLIFDTRLLGDILWSRILFGACPDWFEPALLRRRYDLHLLLLPEGVAWSADGQRCQSELAQRQTFHRECQARLERHRQPYRTIAGNWAERRHQAFVAMQGLPRDSRRAGPVTPPIHRQRGPGLGAERSVAAPWKVVSALKQLQARPRQASSPDWRTYCCTDATPSARFPRHSWPSP